MRVAAGLASGVAVTVLGGQFLARRDPLVGRVLAAVGLEIWNLAVFAAIRLYDLAPMHPGLLGAPAAAL